jgi:hypothetical protein
MFIRKGVLPILISPQARLCCVMTVTFYLAAVFICVVKHTKFASYYPVYSCTSCCFQFVITPSLFYSVVTAFVQFLS